MELDLLRRLLGLWILSLLACLPIAAQDAPVKQQDSSKDKEVYTVPFVLEGKKHVHIVVTITINEKSVKAIVDTGMEKDIIMTQEAKRIGLSEKSPMGTTSVGDLTIENMPWMIYDAQGLVYANRDDKITAVLGYPFLKRFVVTFDFKNKKMFLRKPEARAPDPPHGATTISYTMLTLSGVERGGIILDVKLNGKGPFKALLDTGSPWFRATPELIQKIGGSTAVKTLEVGSITLKNIEFSTHAELAATMRKFKIDILLGLRFLSRYTATIDYQNKQLILSDAGEPAVR